MSKYDLYNLYLTADHLGSECLPCSVTREITDVLVVVETQVSDRICKINTVEQLGIAGAKTVMRGIVVGCVVGYVGIFAKKKKKILATDEFYRLVCWSCRQPWRYLDACSE